MRILLVVFVFFILNINAQLSGSVFDTNNTPLEGVNVNILNSKKGTFTDKNGLFKIEIAKDNYLLNFSFVGFKSKVINVNDLKSIKNKQIKVILESDVTNLETVNITAKTKSQITREQSYAIEAVEMKALKNISTDVVSVLGKVSGVNIRQSGGLGSNTSLSLNGFYGSQIKIFINGIPMHYFGTSLNLNNFPANLVDQIEIYKGVVPIHLSSDALGGAVNIVTNSKNTNFLDASYTFGSFNTNRVAINGQYRYKSGLTFRLKSFYNYSDNNYKVPVTSSDFKTVKWYKRFHDSYKSNMFWPEIGFTKTKFADELMIGALFSSNFNEIQQMPTSLGQAIVPFGEVFTKERKKIFNLSYKKKNILPNLATAMYFVAVNSNSSISDISDYKYDWDGNKKSRGFNSYVGESGASKTQLNLNRKNYLANINNEYEINQFNNIAFNYSLNSLSLKGNDDYSNRNDVRFKNPNYLKKQILGLSYTNKIGDNFKSSLFGKYYHFNLTSIKTDFSGTLNKNINKTLDNYGLGLTASYLIGDLQLKTSYEKSLRFPEVVELFGNGLDVLPNLELNPETSHNINLGLLYNLKYKRHKLLVSLNSFFRNGKEYIYPNSAVFRMYLNALNAQTKGIDVALNYNFKNTYLINFNGSYYNKVNNAKWTDKHKKRKNTFYGIRFPNEPYLFWNIVASYRKKELFKEKDNFTAAIRHNYVHHFFYKWSNVGRFNKRTVPKQQTTDLEFTYSLNANKYNFSLGIQNLSNETVYDNFNQVKPGRTLNFKLRYFINQH